MKTPEYQVNKWSTERWVNGTRFYDILVHQDLWGEWVTTRINGRQTSPLGRIVHEPTANRSTAVDMFNRLRVRREKRGYSRNEEGNPNAR